jgi:ATP/maltotriose-dependent transcriptional regulator MalT
VDQAPKAASTSDRTSVPQAGATRALPVLVLLATTACSGTSAPIDTLAAADLAVRKAEVTAATPAYVGLRQARAKLDAAELAMQADQPEAARRLAEQALVDAQVAEARARAEIALRTVAEMRQRIRGRSDQARPQLVHY